MTAPNMSTITESLERSLRNCSLNNHQRRSGVNGGRGIGRSSSSDDHINNNDDLQNGDATLELNSHMSLPYHWEQCLDLKVSPFFFFFLFLSYKIQFLSFYRSNKWGAIADLVLSLLLPESGIWSYWLFIAFLYIRSAA